MRPFFHLLAHSVALRVSLTRAAPPREPRELLATLNRVQLDPAAIYKVDSSSHIELRRGGAELLLKRLSRLFPPSKGKLRCGIFLAAVTSWRYLATLLKSNNSRIFSAPSWSIGISAVLFAFTDYPGRTAPRSATRPYRTATQQCFRRWLASSRVVPQSCALRFAFSNPIHTRRSVFYCHPGRCFRWLLRFRLRPERDEPSTWARPQGRSLTTTTCGVPIVRPELDHSVAFHALSYRIGPPSIPIIRLTERQPFTALRIRRTSNSIQVFRRTSKL